MTFVYNLLAYAIPIGIVAALVQCIDQFFAGKKTFAPLIAGGGWISFQAWALYFLAGAFNPAAAETPFNIVGTVWILCSYAMGIIAAILIFELAGKLGSFKFFAVPAALVVICIIVMQLQLTQAPLNYVPALFVGAGVFFAIMSYMPSVPGAFPEGASKWTNYGKAAVGELVYCLIGCLAGFAIVAFASVIPTSL
ncbi:MAG: DUF1097 domain-containing protein [Propionibacteriaceae bacterium]|jgi:hypothetical protein|nr:DUF1097 domain-containing protein [Propionibacteriaceae bacterium]